MKGKFEMTVLSVPGIHCAGCIRRIDAALDRAGIKHLSSLDDKTVSIDGGESAVRAAISELYDIGFDAEVKK